MANILDRNNKHILLERHNNTKNSFIANINELVDKLDIIVESNELFDRNTETGFLRTNFRI